MKYPKLEELLRPLGAQAEYRLFAEIVGPGTGVRKRLKEAGFKDYRYDYKVGKVLIEIQGHGFSHSGRGQQRDYLKNNDAVKEGYVVLYYPADIAKKRPDLIIEDLEILNYDNN